MKKQLEKLGQFEITDEGDVLTCRYVCGLIPNQEMFEPSGTAMIKSFKIKAQDVVNFFQGDKQRLHEYIAARLIHVACFDVDLTLYDIHTWYKYGLPRVRNLERITSVLQQLKQLPMWRSIIISNNHLYNITKGVPQGREPDLADMLGAEFFDKIYSRLDMRDLNNKHLIPGSTNNDYTWHRDGSKAYPLRCYYEELLREKALIDANGFITLEDSNAKIIDVVSAFLLDDDKAILDHVQQHGLFPIHASYTALETHPEKGVLQVELNDDAHYAEEMQSIITHGNDFDHVISELPILYQAQAMQPEDDDIAAKGCCWCRKFSKRSQPKPSDTSPLIKSPKKGAL